jgi:hypothetical protein
MEVQVTGCEDCPFVEYPEFSSDPLCCGLDESLVLDNYTNEPQRSPELCPLRIEPHTFVFIGG